MITTGTEKERRVEVFEGFGRGGEGSGLPTVHDRRDCEDFDKQVDLFDPRSGKLLSARPRRTARRPGPSRRRSTARSGGWQRPPARKDFTKRVEVFEKADGRSVRTTGGALQKGVLLAGGGEQRVFIEEQWGQRYTKNVWKTEAHGGPGSADHISKTEIWDGIMTVQGYHLKRVTVTNGAIASQSTDATVTWFYRLNADNSINRLTQWGAVDGGYSATWDCEAKYEKDL